jgi:hypothetical protein
MFLLSPPHQHTKPVVGEPGGDPDTEANHREPRRGAEPAIGVVPARQPDDSRDHELMPTFTCCS